MTAPTRIQLRRTRGWRLPEGTVVVARPSKWGNPFRLHVRTSTLDEIRAELAGRDLACWCRPADPCHADVLLELANGGDGP